MERAVNLGVLPGCIAEPLSDFSDTTAEFARLCSSACQTQDVFDYHEYMVFVQPWEHWHHDRLEV
eukprot:4277778-Amphidinium_carterae.2